MLEFQLLTTDASSHARRGTLRLNHGLVQTPIFMPVGTQATIKSLLPRDMLNDLDAKIMLSNTYHLYLRPGHETVRKLGGLHKFMQWPRAILTDSGGFQVFSLDSLRKVTEEGVIFHSHLNGDRHVFTPESTIDVQVALGSDIMMVLDECLAYPASHAAAKASTDRTLRWARAAYKHYRERSEGKQACFPIVQGSMYADLRRYCTEQLLELDADGYAIGGLSVGEPADMMYEMTRLIFHAKGQNVEHLSVSSMMELTRRRILSNPDIPKHIKQKMLLAMMTPVPKKHLTTPMSCQPNCASEDSTNQ